MLSAVRDQSSPIGTPSTAWILHGWHKGRMGMLSLCAVSLLMKFPSTPESINAVITEDILEHSPMTGKMKA